MKKSFFSGLIFCGLLLAAAQTNAQTFEQNGTPIMVSSPDHAGLFAYAENNIVILRWAAGNERNVDQYVIEHSTDSNYFTALHEITSRGVIDTDSSYEDADTYPAATSNYYRLKTVFRDGNVLYSPVIRVDIGGRYQPTLRPTVLHSGGTLYMENYNLYNQPLTVNIYNARGTLLGSWIVNSSSFNINTERLPTGILFFRISDERHPLIDAGKLMIQ